LTHPYLPLLFCAFLAASGEPGGGSSSLSTGEKSETVRPINRPTDRPTDRVRVFKDAAHTYERVVSELRIAAASRLSRRFSCSRYIGQPRRLSRFLRAIHLHALLCRYLSPPHPSCPPSPPILGFTSSPLNPFAFVGRTLYGVFPLSRPDLAKCRDPHDVSRRKIAVYLTYVLVSPRHFYRHTSTGFSRRLLSILRFPSTQSSISCSFSYDSKSSSK